MKLPESRLWLWSIRLSVPGLIALMWWATASKDVEWMLWRRYPAPIAALNVAGSAALIAAGHVLGSSKHRGRRLRTTMLMMASVLVTITLFEVPAALFGHDYGRNFGTRTNDTWLQLTTGINRADPDLLHVHRPHSRFVGTVTGNLVGEGIPPIRYPTAVE